jgi:hypothetical protein
MVRPRTRDGGRQNVILSQLSRAEVGLVTRASRASRDSLNPNPNRIVVTHLALASHHHHRHHSAASALLNQLFQLNLRFTSNHGRIHQWIYQRHCEEEPGPYERPDERPREASQALERRLYLPGTRAWCSQVSIPPIPLLFRAILLMTRQPHYSYHPLPVVFERAEGARYVIGVHAMTKSSYTCVNTGYGTQRARSISTFCQATRTCHVTWFPPLRDRCSLPFITSQCCQPGTRTVTAP